MRVFLCVLALMALAASNANAAQEKKCSAQYSQEEQLTLEWAALGGDPHAQFAITRCAAPRGRTDLTEAERIYALKWLMLSACDANGEPGNDARDRMTRRLKFNGDISFRRFGGITQDETWTAREKKFIEFRRAAVADLDDRYAAFAKTASPAERSEARKELSDELARMGPRGMMRLADIAQCQYFDADKTFVAAALSAANQVWHSSRSDALYGKSERKGSNLAKQSSQAMSALSPQEKRVAEAEKQQLVKTDPFVLAELEDSAALSRLDQLSFMYAKDGHVSFAGRSVTLAVQYALEALGMMQFVNGPDNDYGPSTIEAARKAQAAYGYEETRWLSPDQIRKIVCDAATKKNDPVSYYHLAMMFSEGWGYPKDLDRARFAIDRAETAMTRRLASLSKLPEWKQDAYPTFKTKIDSVKAMIDGEVAVRPAHVAARPGSISANTLCN